MRSMGDPDYIYRPWSDERRRAVGRRAKHRFMRERSDLIGPLLPSDRDPIRDSRYKKMGLIAANSDMAAFEWTYERRLILSTMWTAGRTQIEIAEAIGATKGTVSGFIFRNKMSRTSRHADAPNARGRRSRRAEPNGDLPVGSRVHLKETYYEANPWHYRMPWGVLERYVWAQNRVRVLADVRWGGDYSCLSTYDPDALEPHA